jgi:hypothetical protein
MVPAAVGVQETSYLLVATVFGISPAVAIAASFARRARDLTLGVATLGIALVGDATFAVRTPRLPTGSDRYECDISAVDQSGYDPTQQDGGVAPDAEPVKRAEYFRGGAACLEARGYRVR